MLDLGITITSFVTNDDPTSQSIQFRPVMSQVERWGISHVSPDDIDVKVWKWTRGGDTIHEVVKLPVAEKMAQECRAVGWYEERCV